MDTISYVKAGTTLLAATLRDPAPILSLSTIWQFMQVVETDMFTDAEQATLCYQHHIACCDRIYRLRNDMMPVGDGDLIQIGPQLIEAHAAYAVQAADTLAFLIDHRPALSIIPLIASLEQVMHTIVREVMEVPHGQEVDHALDLFRKEASIDELL
jgi:hypothetical protein